jgi:hypothetical protein
MGLLALLHLSDLPEVPRKQINKYQRPTDQKTQTIND